MTEPIPFLDLPRQHQVIAGELLPAIAEAVSHAAFIGGARVDEFEGAFADFCGVKGTVGVANGTDALMLALRVLGVGPGDEVVLPAFTFIATAEAVTMLGARPRLADVDPATYTLTAEAAREAGNGQVKAMIPVHLYGQAADMDSLLRLAQERGWKVVEDAAQAHGARYELAGKAAPVGSLGHLGAFSFYPGKNLGAMGDGGAVVGNDVELLDRVRRIANHGRATKHEHGEPGVNSRLDALHAIALGLKLRHLSDWNAARARVAALYTDRLAGVKDLVTPSVGAGRTHVYHLYVVRVPERDQLLAALRTAGIGCGVHYPLPLHLQPAYQQLGYGRGDFPVAEKVAAECVSLPMFPELSESQVDRVADAVRTHLQAGG